MHLAGEDVLVAQHILNALEALRQRGFSFFTVGDLEISKSKEELPNSDCLIAS